MVYRLIYNSVGGCIALLLFLITAQDVRAEARIKDIVNFEGVRENVLVGYGLVVGLNGTGDNLKNSIFTEKGLSDFLEKLGINTRGTNLKSKNVAAVMVTATLPAFARIGSKININVSTLGDAKSLKGGTLLATTLLGADGEVYAIAQGPLSIGSPADATDKNAKFVPTSGYIISGAIIEREIMFALNQMQEIKLALKTPDITTARSISTAINAGISGDCATPLDPGTISIKVPKQYTGNVMGLLADVENMQVEQDVVAKVVIDEASGTVVIGENVRISTVAVAQGNLVLQVSPEAQMAYDISSNRNKIMPQPSAPGTKIAVMESSTSLQDVVEGLNALGVTPKDLVAILQTIQRAGALQAEIEVR